jgi:tetratricopeptide (TPR) repeat protein
MYNLMGNALYTLERFKEAQSAYTKAISLGFKSASLYATLGNLLYHLGDYQKALNSYEQAIVLNSSLPAAYNGKGNVLKVLVNDPKSEQLLPKRASFCPEE